MMENDDVTSQVIYYLKLRSLRTKLRLKKPPTLFRQYAELNVKQGQILQDLTLKMH